MNEFVIFSATFGVIVSLIGYQLGLFLKNKTKSSLCNPILISVVFVVILLLIFDIEYASYYDSGKYLSYLLTPTTVCLAIPLYEQLHLLKGKSLAIFAGILSGVLANMLSIYALSMLFALDHEMFVTLLPKSVTTAIGVGISEEFGGISSITSICIMSTGILGNIIAESVLKLFCITNPIAKGIAIGSSSHAVGTARAMEMGEIEGAMSSLSIVITSLCTIFCIPFFVNLI